MQADNLFIDGSNLYIRAAYAFRGDKRPADGNDAPATFNFLRMLSKLVSELKPRRGQKNYAAANMHNMIGSKLSEKAKNMFPGYSALHNSLLIADDFISNLILFHEFQKQLEMQVETATLG